MILIMLSILSLMVSDAILTIPPYFITRRLFDYYVSIKINRSPLPASLANY